VDGSAVSIFELLSRKQKSLLIWRDTFFWLDRFFLHPVRLGEIDEVERDRLTGTLLVPGCG
jgi:hypothetical protein